MNGSKNNSRVVRHDFFRAVPVMGVDVPDCHSLNPILERIECCDRDVAEITKTHGPLTHRVVTGRTHQAKGATSLFCFARGIHRGTSCSGGVLKNPRMCWGIGIEIEPGIPNFCEVLACMNPQQRIVIKDSWIPPFPFRMSIL